MNANQHHRCLAGYPLHFPAVIYERNVEAQHLLSFFQEEDQSKDRAALVQDEGLLGYLSPKTAQEEPAVYKAGKKVSVPFKNEDRNK
mmetsp:Transcript_9890/g.17507  ORF Transcript_9890/g.17507 Transcript_9890/m.17507 type:complete len:87 (+) Transcript_9890:322-582(+)